MKRHPEIRLFLLDGLNNTGKTTQLNLLRSRLAAAGITGAVRKGDGSRKGLGLQDYDPESSWWKQHRLEATSAGTDGERAKLLATIASRKLLIELVEFKHNEFPEILALNGANRGVILLDRGHVSRLFVSRRFDRSVALDEAIGITDSPELSESYPDKINILHATKEALLLRTVYRDDGMDKKQFNDDLITKYYDDFQDTIYNLPQPLKEITSILDASQSIEDVNAQLLHSIEEMY